MFMHSDLIAKLVGMLDYYDLHAKSICLEKSSNQKA